MKRVFVASLLVCSIYGCYSDIAVTEKFKSLEQKRIYVGQIECDNPRVGEILQDCIQKEFVKAKLDISNQDDATMIIGGSVFITPKKDISGTGVFGEYGGGVYGAGKEKILIDSVSLQVKAKDGTLLAIASFNNWADLNVEEVGRYLGGDLANKLK